jgi:hypothetical protein
LPKEFAQCPQLVTAERVRGGLAVLRAEDVERGGAAEFDLAPGPGGLSRSPAASCGRRASATSYSSTTQPTPAGRTRSIATSSRWRKRWHSAQTEKKFKIEPQRLLYSLQWKHNGTPPDFHLQLVRDPQVRFRRCYVVWCAG